MFLDRQTHLTHGREHFGAQVAVAIDRRNREVAALDGRPVAHVAFRIVLQVGPGTFDAVDLEAGVVAAGAELDAVEDEELGLGADGYGVADAAGLDVGFAQLGGGARIAAVELSCRRLDDIAEHDQAWLGRERIHDRRGRIRHQDHVALVDRLPAGDGRSVEHDSVTKRVFVHGGDVLRGMLPLAAWIGESEVHVFHGIIAEHLEHLGHVVARTWCIAAAAGFFAILFPR